MQSIPQVQKLFDREFRADINRHINNEDEADRKAAMIKEAAKDLVQPGQEFHPWTFDNFTEAIENAPRGERMVMFASISEADHRGLNDNFANHLALTSITKMVEDYWNRAAIVQAEKDLKTQ